MPVNQNANKVKTKDLYRPNAYSAKNTKSATLLLNKDVDREEQIAGIALLKKHEQALNRYENAHVGGNAGVTAGIKTHPTNETTSSDYYAKQAALKPDWNTNTQTRPKQSATSKVSPYMSLLNEPEGYQFI